MWCDVSTITDVFFFCSTVMDVVSCFFFPRNIPFPSSVVFLTIHVNGRRVTMTLLEGSQMS